MVKNVWEQPVAGLTPSQRWNSKLHTLQKYLGGWAQHMTGQLKKGKLGLSSNIDDLEAIAKMRSLMKLEINLKS
jgi:hypothetical protein